VQGDVLRAIRDLTSDVDLFDQIVADEFRIHRTDLRSLEILYRLGPTSAGSLAEAIGLTSGAATAAIDRLERADLARRRPDATDRRRVLVEPTEEGTRRAESIFRELGASLERLLAAYDGRDLALMRDFLRTVGRTFVERAEAIQLRQ
jgi:DNA-binding MarR family transcriptional regulator